MTRLDPLKRGFVLLVTAITPETEAAALILQFDANDVAGHACRAPLTCSRRFDSREHSIAASCLSHKLSWAALESGASQATAAVKQEKVH